VVEAVANLQYTRLAVCSRFAQKIKRFVDAVGAGYGSEELKQQLNTAVAERDRLRAAPPVAPPVNVVRVVTDAVTRYHAMLANLGATFGKSAERAQAVLAALFETIPVDRRGLATVTLDTRRVLDFGGRNLDGSGGSLPLIPTQRRLSLAA
jgi:hypothetical protein